MLAIDGLAFGCRLFRMTPMASVRLHPRTIEAVKERADIVDVVGEHVVLKKKGREFVGICPFHDDSKPSMTVSPAKQFSQFTFLQIYIIIDL